MALKQLTDVRQILAVYKLEGTTVYFFSHIGDQYDTYTDLVRKIVVAENIQGLAWVDYTFVTVSDQLGYPTARLITLPRGNDHAKVYSITSHQALTDVLGDFEEYFAQRGKLLGEAETTDPKLEFPLGVVVRVRIRGTTTAYVGVVFQHIGEDQLLVVRVGDHQALFPPVEHVDHILDITTLRRRDLDEVTHLQNLLRKQMQLEHMPDQATK